MDQLHRRLVGIDGRPYPAYKDLRGQRFDLLGGAMRFDHVQGDPFAGPSRLELRFPISSLNVRPTDIESRSRRIGIEDALLRSFAHALRGASGNRGSGKSGRLGVCRVGQEMLPRTACVLADGYLTVRLTAGLPARGRRILGRQAAQMLTEDLPRAVEAGIFNADSERLRAHADANEDQDSLRELVEQRGWEAFIANNSLLPRASGVDDGPLAGGVPWQSPAALEASVNLPNAGEVTGTAIPRGVTLICGGGYHGKSTLLNAIARSVYNHIPGDGRDLCATSEGAVSVRAEDGRAVSGVDISAFIGILPDGRSTEAFHSANASGSTSQAANIVEALEVGASLLLIDEDTSATNFMVRDRRMQELIARDHEPITPFVDRVRGLHLELEVSTILVVGGSGDYFEVADHVLVMDAYHPRLETETARHIAETYPSGRLEEDRPPLLEPLDRRPKRAGFNAQRGRRNERVRARETQCIQFGEEEIDIALLAQLVDDGQARAIGDWLLQCSRGLADGERSLNEICDSLEADAERDFSATTQDTFGDRVLPRRFEFAAAVNRLRSLKVA